MKLAVFFFLFVVLSVTFGFAPVARTSTKTTTGTTGTTGLLWMGSSDDDKQPAEQPTTMDINRLNRAVECAENYGRCPVEELLELADGMYMSVCMISLSVCAVCV